MKRTKLQKARYRKGLSQEALAEEIGVSRNEVSQWENGHRTPYPLYVGKLCNFFGVDDPAALDLQIQEDNPSDPAQGAMLTPAKQPDLPATDAQATQHLQEITYHPSSPVIHQISISGNQTNPLLTSSFTLSKNGVFLPNSLPIDIISTETSSIDCATWFGIMQAQIITNVVQWKKGVLLCDERQAQLDQEIRMFDQMMPLFNDEEKYSLSRRQALISIAMLPIALLKTPQQKAPSEIDIEEFLTQCTGSITAMWHLLKGKDFLTVEKILLESLPVLIMLSRKSSPYQEIAAQLASQNCLLMSLMSRHHGNNLALDEWYCREAVYYSEITNNRLLKVATLKQLADTCYYRSRYSDMLLTYERAWQYVTPTPGNDDISPLLRARICSGLAYACVKNGDAERAKGLLSQAQETFPQPVSVTNDYTPLYADCGVHSLYLWGGLTRRLLDQPEEAEKTLARVEQLAAKNIFIPERTRVEIITHQAAVAIMQGNMEAFCSYFTATMEGITRISSEKRRQEAIGVYRQAQQEWPGEKCVSELAHLFIPLH